MATPKVQRTGQLVHRVLKLSRTIADLASTEHVTVMHLAKALQYRPKVVEGERVAIPLEPKSTSRKEAHVLNLNTYLGRKAGVLAQPTDRLRGRAGQDYCHPTRRLAGQLTNTNRPV